ncbi:hypothetical protein [Aeromicrobium sp. HA]|uniref:hypothetical protein n=1 Tax=Aeromicrobium sp. HA TaxID=3009077 RepID=UPI0022B064D8|nr:hypothetical protein [Aeromicrobium sp. HA]
MVTDLQKQLRRVGTGKDANSLLSRLDLDIPVGSALADEIFQMLWHHSIRNDCLGQQLRAEPSSNDVLEVKPARGNPA